MISLAGETYRGGLASILTAKCSGCRLELAFPTSNRVTCIGEATRWECNVEAVWGQMVTGGGYAPLEESLAVLGVPVMTKKAFIATERDLAQAWRRSYARGCRRRKKDSNKQEVIP